MSDSTAFLIVGLCGLGVVVLGLIIFVFSLIFRFTGRNFMGFLALLLRNARDDEDNKPVVVSRPRPNLRAIAESQDFDTALTKHVVQDEGVLTSTGLQAQSKATSAAPPGFEDVSSELQSRRRRLDEVRRKSRSDEDADLFGSLLDDDDDE
jgi:hypothetical protein